MCDCCPCYCPEDAATESVDSCYDMPPLIPAPAPGPLFSAADTQQLKQKYEKRKRELLSKRYEHHINDAISDLLSLHGADLKRRMTEAIDRAEETTGLTITLFNYKKVMPTKMDTDRGWESYTDRDGNWWTSLYAFCDASTTTLGGVEVDFLVRKTNFLEKLVARIGDPKYFIIKKAVRAVDKWDESDIDIPYFPCKTVELCLWLEYWPKGVTDRRRRECEP